MAAPMPQATVSKRLRKGTKSCIECRHRKIRCIWHSPSDPVCAGCQTRNRNCVPQVYQRRSVNVGRLSSKDRIQRLEQQLASITAAAKDTARQSGAISASPGTHHGHESSASAEDTDAAYDPTEGPAATPPTHLRFLFDSALLGPDEQQNADRDPTSLSSARCSRRYLDQARARLQRLMPSREDITAIAGYVAPWMTLYLTMFRTETAIQTSDQLLSKYEEASADNAHPIVVAMLLLHFGITIRQVPQADGLISLHGWCDNSSYVRELSHVVESTIVNNTGIASTVEGIETTIMYLRLQLGLGNVKNLWLTLRRTIALAELNGLQRVWYSSNAEQLRHLPPSTTSSASESRKARKIAIWEAICATDRLGSMMFNLPAATSTHRFPRKQILSSDGEVVLTNYMFELSGIAMTVQELDEAYTLGHPAEEVYEKVLSADRHLRSLKVLTPKSWWILDDQRLSSGRLIQFWHYYLTARMHLHSAMSDDENDQYAYSRTTCLDACEVMARRYSVLRSALPAGFFVCRIVDMQIFTAATFLVLSCLRQRQAGPHYDEQRLTFAKQIIDTMEFASAQIGGEFPREASLALRLLMALLEDPATASSSSKSLTLQIPLVGKVHIGRKEAHGERPAIAGAEPQPTQQSSANLGSGHGAPHVPINGSDSQDPISMSFNTGLTDTLPWLMEFDIKSSSLQDPFLAEGFPDFDPSDQYMAWNNPL